MEFSPAFKLLPKFTVGLQSTPVDANEAAIVSTYLGIEIPEVALDERIRLLEQELLLQNRFLSTELSSDSIFASDEYRRSRFVREVVKNNRDRKRFDAGQA